MTPSVIARTLAYSLVTGGYFLGAGLDAWAGRWKSATVAFIFGVAAVVIFFWRE